jgi:hypothetical protein
MMDMDRIEELRAEIGSEDLLMILGVFLDEAEEVLSGLAPEGPDAQRRLHFVRSGALNLGLTAVVAAAEGSGEGAADWIAAALQETRRAVGALGGGPA